MPKPREEIPKATKRLATARTPGMAGINIGSDYTDDERDFLVAMDRYKRENRRPFPSWREVLTVFLSLGYRKVAAADLKELHPKQVTARKNAGRKCRKL